MKAIQADKLQNSRAEVRELLARIEGLSRNEKRIVLASLRGMLIVADSHKAEARAEEEKGA